MMSRNPVASLGILTALLLIAALDTSPVMADPAQASLTEDALEKCADAGIAECQFRYAQILESKGSTDLNNERARELYEMAYKGGHDAAGAEILRILSSSSNSTLSTAANAPSVPSSQRPPPRYPPAALIEKRYGTVTLELVINKDGTVAEANVHSTSGHKDLDEAAVAAANEWLIADAPPKPGSQHSVIRVPVDFSLDENVEPRKLLDFHLGQSQQRFMEIVPNARCAPDEELPATICEGQFQSTIGRVPVKAAFGSGKLVGAAIKLRNTRQCNAAYEELRRLNGLSTSSISSLFALFSQGRKDSVMYWGDELKGPSGAEELVLVGDAIMLACSKSENTFVGSLGPGSHFGSSPFLDLSDR